MTGLPIRALAVAVTATALAAPLLTAPAYAAESPPRTGFEQTNGARWTSQSEEQDFLAAFGKASDRVAVSEIGTTEQGRPLQLVRVGALEQPPPCTSCAAGTATSRPGAKPAAP